MPFNTSYLAKIIESKVYLYSTSSEKDEFWVHEFCDWI